MIYYDEDGNRELDIHPVKEEPDCHTCCDSGALLAFPPGTDEVVEENCPDCNPTPEQAAAQLVEAERAGAEYERRVEAGEIAFEEAPF